MTYTPNRRDALTLLSATALASCAGDEKSILKEAAENPVFAHGVASGDPDNNSLVLWTGITTTKDVATVTWQISKTKDFAVLAGSGQLTTSAKRDYTVKVIAKGLETGQSYYYQFETDSISSPIGRTKTLPGGSPKSLGIALVSCSHYTFGFFNAYDAIAKDEAIDFVLHTGDYIYEYGANGWGHETGEIIGRFHAPAHEIISLSDYRTRHAQYKADANTQAMHAAHTLLCLWDDHESANNPWMHGAKNHNPDEGEGEWAPRRAASLQAYYEWMPIREPAPGLTRAEFWRSYVFGDLATLVTLETRHLARAKQIDEKDHFASINSQADAEKFKAEVLNEPGRKMISDKMEAFLTDAMKTSKTAGQPWRLIGNATPIARIGVPDMEKLGVLKQASLEQMQSDAAKKIVWQGKYNMPYYTDSWDGYPWAREKLYAAGRSVGVHDMLFLTGDSHSFWMNRLFDDAGDAVGLELGTAGVTSPGDFVGNGWDLETATKLDKVLGDEVEEVVWTDNFNQGYVRVELSPTEAKVSFMAVSTILKPSYTIRVLKETVIKHKGNSIEYTNS